VKNGVNIFILVITIILVSSQVNSVVRENKIKKYFYIEKINKNQCIQNWINKSYNIKEKNIQKRALSCEISAAADILSFFEWKKITEDLLLNKLDKSEYRKLPITEKNWKKWWNPEEGFVWYINKLPNWEKARQRKMTGYWVLEKPIENIFKNYWYKTQIINEFDYNKNFNKKDHLELILQEFKNWNMIQLWWDICTDPKYYSNKEHICFYNWKLSWNQDRKISWEYKDKNWNIVKYNGLNWEHAFYLLGFKWTVKNPTDLIVWDTATWEHTYPVKEWFRKWWKMQYRSIIIYKK